MKSDLVKFFVYFVIIFSAIMISGCIDTSPSTDKVQMVATERLMSEANRQVGMPNITNFAQKKTMKLIQEECDNEDLICYAYLKSDYSGKLVYIGKCIGYGVPFSAQYTNPMRALDGPSTGEFTTIPQPDPNGLFMPTSSSATWLLMIDPVTSKPRVAYFEPEIVVVPFKLPE